MEIANREYINPERPRRPEYGGDPSGGGNNGGDPSGSGGGGPPRPADIVKNIDKIEKIATAGVSVIKSIIEEKKKAEEPTTI